MERHNCLVCGGSAKFDRDALGSKSVVDCVRCGRFSIGDSAKNELVHWSDEQIANLSGWIRQNQDYAISSNDLNSLSKLRTPTVGEKADKLLLYLAKEHRKPGKAFSFQSSYCKQPRLESKNTALDFGVVFASVSWAQDGEELDYLVNTFLSDECKYLSRDRHEYRISPTGWARINELRQGNPESKIGFIAMWFDDSMKDASLAIHAGITNAGYEPLRIDSKEHNNKIDDEIIAGIRRSKFLVADFTKHRGGVYFEAGFAMGLGLPVIWLCEKGESNDIHFDTRQYNHIIWEPDKLDELTERLQNRIEATIGEGPLKLGYVSKI